MIISYVFSLETVYVLTGVTLLIFALMTFADRANPLSPFARPPAPGWCAASMMLYYNIIGKTLPATTKR